MKFFFSLIFFIQFIIFQAFALERKYVPGISDLPVPINFHLINDSSAVFYNESGRIVEAFFKGRANRQEISEFYDITLKALGWQKLSFMQYVRENEVLDISANIIDDDQFNNLEIHFLLKPAS